MGKFKVVEVLKMEGAVMTDRTPGGDLSWTEASTHYLSY